MTVIESVVLNRPTVFEKPAPDVDLTAIIAIAETINRSVVDSVDVTDKDAIRQMFGKRTQWIWKMLTNASLTLHPNEVWVECERGVH